MSTFNFGGEQNYTSTAKPRLAGGEIHKVNFKGAEYTELEGKKEANKGMKYNVLQFQFENENGYYTHTIFDPGDQGDIRTETDWNGQKIQSPSPNEQYGMFVGQLLLAIAPDTLKKLEGKSPSGQFEKMSKFIAGLANSAKDTEVELKLMLGKDGSARLPIFASINRQGGVYPSSNFVGNNLYFTDKEKATITKFKSAVPTDTASLVGNRPFAPKAAAPANDDLDWNLD